MYQKGIVDHFMQTFCKKCVSKTVRYLQMRNKKVIVTGYHIQQFQNIDVYVGMLPDERKNGAVDFPKYDSFSFLISQNKKTKIHIFGSPF